MRPLRRFPIVLWFLCTLSSSSTVMAQQVTLPYATSFDTDSGWTSINARGSAWEWGFPDYGATRSTHSAPAAFDVELDTSAADSSLSFLYSPVFRLNGEYNTRLSFWQNRMLEDFFDGFRLDYTLDGSTWIVLGLSGDPNGKNWYSRNNISSSNFPAWTGSSGGWLRSEYRLTQLNGYTGDLRFRFVFTSNDSIRSDGVSIDDFSLLPAAANDAELLGFVHPVNFSVAGHNDSVRVVVRNAGSSVLTAFSCSFTLDGLMNFQQTWNRTLQPSETDTVGFTWQYVPPAGEYRLWCYLENQADGDRSNDTMTARVFGVPRYPLGYSDNFDDGNPEWNAMTTDGDGWNLVSDGSGGRIWDQCPAASYDNHENSYLYSPFITWNGERNVRCIFRQRCETEQAYDGFRLEYSRDGGSTFLPAGAWMEENSLNWYDEAAVSAFNSAPAWSGHHPDWRSSQCLLDELDGFAGDVQFRFHFGADGSTTAPGVVVDAFELRPAPAVDLAINEVKVSATAAIAGTVDTLSVRIRNTGQDSLIDPEILLSMEGSPDRSYRWSGLLAPGEAIDWIVDTIALREGPARWTVRSSVATDGDASNDSAFIHVFGFPVMHPDYTDEMEGAVRYCDVTGAWALGRTSLPGQAAGDSAGLVWHYPAAGGYRSDVNAVLYSPFFDLSDWYSPRLQLRHWFRTQAGADGGRVEFTLDRGRTWAVLGTAGDPQGTQWYSQASLNSSGLPGWCGESNGWMESEFELTSLSDFSAEPVQFRFVFTSDDSVAADGWMIAAVRLLASPEYSVAPVAVDGFPDPFQPVLPAQLQCRIRNTGALPVTSLHVKVRVDTTDWIDQPVSLSSPLPSMQSAVIPLAQVWWPGPGNHALEVVAQLTGATDGCPADDTLRLQAGILDTTRLDATANWCDDFDSGEPAWLGLDPLTRVPQQDWRFGVPDKPGWSTVWNGAHAWVTGLDSDYAPSVQCALYTPVFSVDSGKCYRFSFHQLLGTEQFQDGGIVEYSTDYGGSWEVLGAAGDPGWYNSNYITGLGYPPVPGFSGHLDQWTAAQHDLVLLNDHRVIFRFRFGADASVQGNGWAIDQVCFAPVTSCTIGLEEDAKRLAIDGPFPNPAKEEIRICGVFDRSRVKFGLFDLSGKFIRETEQIETNAACSVLSLKEVPPGFYLLRLQQDEAVIFRKLVVE